jgi:hypothetical protein
MIHKKEKMDDLEMIPREKARSYSEYRFRNESR